MAPDVGCRNLVSKLKNVVLPAPFGPIRPWISPRRTRKDTPSTATNPLNDLTKLCVSRITSCPNAIARCPLKSHGPGLCPGRMSSTVNLFKVQCREKSAFAGRAPRLFDLVVLVVLVVLFVCVVCVVRVLPGMPFLEVIGMQSMTRQELVEISPAALGKTGGLGHVAGGSLQVLGEIIAREFIPRLTVRGYCLAMRECNILLHEVE